MSQSSLLISSKDKVMTISLNRPDKCNALDGDLVQQLQDAFFAASRDSKIQLVLLTGNGKHFCAGADLDWMKKLTESSFELNRDDARKLSSLLYRMYSFPKPIITLAKGSILGGGLGLLACSDIIISSNETNFCFSEVKLGLVPAVVSPYVVAMIGQHAARYYFLTAEQFNAAEALRLGLVHKLVPQAELEAAGATLINTLLQHSPAALAEVKRLLPFIINREISLEVSEKTAEFLARSRVSDQAKEGLKAFIEKRQPNWDQK